ncbi:glycosyltransferase family 4 protein [Paenibacillus ginsengarvi]|uniref:Glycosyltransferase family 1 protein n=1 Tax=Paenibacillus ginsengarvi TaxID=400777 RepID=A0A3B0CKB0_9BACL|nr:glycosyltransferase family 4 protein [Paenibacillus ginsengarvi]RKN85652.1 glycosyltransferase family 1 protein [Paenibacillus ginsengarvi]
MKKILQVCAIDISVDGLLKPLVLESMRQGYVVHNACTDTGRFAQLEQQGLTMRNVPIDRKISLISNLKSLFRLYRLMKTEKYEIVHVHTPVAAILGRVAAKLAGAKHIIYTAHGFYFHDGMSQVAYRVFYGLEKFFAKYFTDWLLLQSREDYELSLDHRFTSSDRIMHLGNGVDVRNKFNMQRLDPNRLATLKEQFGIAHGDIVFSFIGRFVKEKGVLELLEAFTRLRSCRPRVKLLMIGDVLQSERDQETRLRIEEQLKGPGIIAPGYRKDIPDLLALSDVFVLPSYREGLPRSIIEAMAMGKPVIATNIRGCREEVIQGENGLLVKKGNSAELFDSMLELADDGIKREVFGRNGRQMAEAMFDESVVISNQIRLFDALCFPDKSLEVGQRVNHVGTEPAPRSTLPK